MLKAYRAMIGEAVRRLRVAHTVIAPLRHRRQLTPRLLVRGGARTPSPRPARTRLAQLVPAIGKGEQHDHHPH